MLFRSPRPAEVEDELAESIRKAGREDCTKAYRGAGLLAVVPIAIDTVRPDNKGCKW